MCHRPLLLSLVLDDDHIAEGTQEIVQDDKELDKRAERKRSQSLLGVALDQAATPDANEHKTSVPEAKNVRAFENPVDERVHPTVQHSALELGSLPLLKTKPFGCSCVRNDGINSSARLPPWHTHDQGLP